MWSVLGLEVEDGNAQLAVLAVVTFALFFILDPFRILAKVDERRVRLYELPKGTQSCVEGKRVLCLVNPFSGGGEGLWQYGKVAFPLLRHAGAEVEMTETTHAGHFGSIAKELTRRFLDGDASAAPDGGVLIFGGDGSVTEFLNGVMEEASKDDPELGLRHPDVGRVLEALPFAHVPVGTGNGIATSNGCMSVYDAIVQVIEGDGQGRNTHPVDLNMVACAAADGSRQQTLVDMLAINLGVISDHDDLAERKWRSMHKTLRAALAPLATIMRKKSYSGKIFLKPLEAEDEELQKQHGYRSAQGLPDAEAESHNVDLTGFKQIEGDFLMVTCMNLRSIASDVTVAPGTEFHDGKIGVAVIRSSTSRLQLVRAFDCMGKGTAAHLPYAELYSATAVVLDPDSTLGLSASGEPIDNADTVTVESFRGIGRYLRDPARAPTGPPAPL